MRKIFGTLVGGLALVSAMVLPAGAAPAHQSAKPAKPAQHHVGKAKHAAVAHRVKQGHGHKKGTVKPAPPTGGTHK
jgi:hypothetical protein